MLVHICIAMKHIFFFGEAQHARLVQIKFPAKLTVAAVPTEARQPFPTSPLHSQRAQGSSLQDLNYFTPLRRLRDSTQGRGLSGPDYDRGLPAAAAASPRPFPTAR